MASRDIVFAILGIASLLVASAAATEFVRFGYDGSSSTGPDKWGSLSSDYQTCSTGKQQSPINIVKDEAVFNASLDPLMRSYDDANATLINHGFNVELRYEESVGSAVVDGKNYSLQSLHWHSPSEHTIDGERFPMEVHLVHKSEDGSIVVVAILYKYGHSDPFLFQLKEKAKELAREQCSDDEEAQVAVGVVENKGIKRATRKYFRYVGSLTTPPCTENVTWNVLGKVRQLSTDQAAALRAPLASDCKNNSRPVQPLNGRTITLYDEKHKAKHSQ